MLPPLMLNAFPDLEFDHPVVTHPADPDYNCVAWAVGVTTDRWWPNESDAEWPPDVADELTLATMIATLGTFGYVPCDTGVAETGFEKAAVYAKGGVPTHVAKQLPGGRWSSKLGKDCVVSHATPAGLEGAVYGQVVAYLRRPAG
jgi:hypothetical protein